MCFVTILRKTPTMFTVMVSANKLGETTEVIYFEL